MANPPSTSQSAPAKIQRAINQIERSEILIRQLPASYYKNKKEIIIEITKELERLRNKIEVELANN